VSAPPDARAWEAAYLAFETPEQERAKFQRRLARLGAQRWPREVRVAELFCGRGSGLRALLALGFRQVVGVDLSLRLLAHRPAGAACLAADCRRLPFADGSLDVVIVQGGLHHLPLLPDDLERVLAEAARALRAQGQLVVVEPWLTPFLALVHGVCRVRVARRLSRRLDALAAMIEHERVTYEQWLGQPRAIRALFERGFVTEHCSVRAGKLWYRGRKRAG
jgi:SAM-dependent methyltransferase